MPRSRSSKLPRPPAPPPEPLTDDDGDSWFSPAPQEGELELPPAPGSFRQPPEPAPPALVDLGPPPLDAMEAEKWAHRLLMLSAHEAIKDNSLSQPERRRELRVILSAAKGHVTDAMRFDAKELIKRNAAELANRKRNKAAAKLVARPSTPGAKVIPIRRG